MASAIRAVDHATGSSPAIMSTTAGTIAFGTTFLALAAGLAVFAAVRNKGFNPQPPPEYVNMFMANSPQSSLSNLLEEERIPKVSDSAESSTSTTTTTTAGLLPTTTTKKTTTSNGPNRHLVTGRPLSNNRRQPAGIRNRKLTTLKPLNELDNDQVEELSSTKGGDGVEMISDFDNARQLFGHNSRRFTSSPMTTPRISGAFNLKPRNLNPRRFFASSWPPRTSTLPPFEPVVGPRLTRSEGDVVISSVLNDPIPSSTSRHSNNVRRRETTVKSVYKTSFMPQLSTLQIFADEPPPGYQPDATAAPFLLTLFTTPENESIAENSSRQGHRRSVLPPTSATNKSMSTSATSLIVVVAFLGFVSVLLAVALLIQRRNFLSKLRNFTLARVLPLPATAVIDLSCSSSSVSPASSGSSSPNQQHSFATKSSSCFIQEVDGDDKTITSDEIVDGSIRLSVNSYPLQLHHY